MTADIVEALEKLQQQSFSSAPDGDGANTKAQDNSSREPTLSEPSIGKPISHGQVIDISRRLKDFGLSPYHLDLLLRGSRVYITPPPPKPEPTPEYRALMVRLRREQESRDYDRMTNSLPGRETFSQRFPTASAAYAFSSTASYEPLNNSSTEEDGITYANINRQVTLIFNVLISVFACAAAIWRAAKWWNTPARLALSMSGSLLVGVAEVVVYTGYIRRLREARDKEGEVKEVKEIVKTWVVGGDEEAEGEEAVESVAIISKEDQKAVRERKKRKGGT